MNNPTYYCSASSRQSLGNFHDKTRGPLGESEFSLEADYLHDLRMHPFDLIAVDEIGQLVYLSSLMEWYRRHSLRISCSAEW